MAGPGPYGSSGFLNEIHTHFPALLYDSRQFNTVRDVFGYVEQQMSARFDVYSNQRQRYRQRNRQRGRPVSAPQPPAPVRTFIPLNPPVSVDYFSDPLTRLLLATLITPAGGLPLPTNFMEPIHVIATGEQIARGSTLSRVSVAMDSPCAICQDTIAVGDRIRQLNACTHAFHQACVDTWFQRHVQCPVCRHDIRGVASSPASAVAV